MNGNDEHGLKLEKNLFQVLILCLQWPVSKFSGALWQWGGEKKECLQLRLWNLNSTSNSPVAPHGLSCQISANQHEVEMSTNVNKH